MRTKTGNMLHSKGNILPVLGRAPVTRSAYAEALAAILRAEVGRPRGGTKALMKWTGASERTVKGWLGGEHGPRGEHLILLMAKSDAIFAAVLRLAERDRGHFDADIIDARQLMRGALAILEKIDP